jgi:hypothetical protein
MCKTFEQKHVYNLRTKISVKLSNKNKLTEKRYYIPAHFKSSFQEQLLLPFAFYDKDARFVGTNLPNLKKSNKFWQALVKMHFRIKL